MLRLIRKEIFISSPSRNVELEILYVGSTPPRTSKLRWCIPRLKDRVHTDEKWWPSKTPSQMSCDTQTDHKASRSLSLQTLHKIPQAGPCRPASLVHWLVGFWCKARTSSSKSNICRRLLFSAHKFFLAVSFVHRGGDLSLVTSSTSSNCRNLQFYSSPLAHITLCLGLRSHGCAVLRQLVGGGWGWFELLDRRQSCQC